MPVTIRIPRSDEGVRERIPFSVLDMEAPFFPLCRFCQVHDTIRPHGCATCVTCVYSRESHFDDPRKVMISKTLHDIKYNFVKNRSSLPQETRFLSVDVENAVWESPSVVCWSCEYLGILVDSETVYAAVKCTACSGN
jgi:hypothetical protein